MSNERIKLVNSIVELNDSLEKFWSSAKGWAPQTAAELLSKSRLDWQVSLSHTLKIWLRPTNESLTEGELILAWANLGALVEGTLKLFLSVYEREFVEHVAEIKHPKAFDNKKNVARQPDELMLDTLRTFCVRKDIFKKDRLDFIYRVQIKRNAIHAFKDKDIGSAEEFWVEIENYLSFLKLVRSRLPYPYDEIDMFAD